MIWSKKHKFLVKKTQIIQTVFMVFPNLGSMWFSNFASSKI